MTKHYHVLNGLAGGYMPDNNTVYKTKSEARAGLKWLISELREIGVYYGNLKSGQFIAKNGNYYAEISDPCYESECLEDLEE